MCAKHAYAYKKVIHSSQSRRGGHQLLFHRSEASIVQYMPTTKYGPSADLLAWQLSLSLIYSTTGKSHFALHAKPRAKPT